MDVVEVCITLEPQQSMEKNGTPSQASKKRGPKFRQWADRLIQYFIISLNICIYIYMPMLEKMNKGEQHKQYGWKNRWTTSRQNKTTSWCFLDVSKEAESLSEGSFRSNPSEPKHRGLETWKVICGMQIVDFPIKNGDYMFWFLKTSLWFQFFFKSGLWLHFIPQTLIHQHQYSPKKHGQPSSRRKITSITSMWLGNSW